MGLRAPKYETLKELLDHIQLAEEDSPTAKIIKRLRHAKSNKELSRGEFLDICYWKSPRAIRRCEQNSGKRVEETTRRVFETRSERKRLELLGTLKGVNVPMASAILTLTDPKRYGVIDIRVWQLLYALGSVQNNQRGLGFTFAHWHKYLNILRHHALRLEAPVRNVELTLFQYHRNHQVGSLYR